MFYFSGYIKTLSGEIKSLSGKIKIFSGEIKSLLGYIKINSVDDESGGTTTFQKRELASGTMTRAPTSRNSDPVYPPEYTDRSRAVRSPQTG